MVRFNEDLFNDDVFNGDFSPASSSAPAGADPGVSFTISDELGPDNE